MQVILVRHAQPHDVEAGPGPADPGLTDLGHLQAHRVATILAAEQVQAIYSSPARRTRETAAPLTECTGCAAVLDERLAEFNHGSVDYLSVEEMRRRDDPRWRALERGEIFDSPWTVDELRARVVNTVDAIVERHAGASVAVFTHSGAINLYTGHLVSSAVPIWTAPGYASITRVLANRAGRRTLMSLSESVHLFSERRSGTAHRRHGRRDKDHDG